MKRTFASTARAQRAYELVEGLQRFFTEKLDDLSMRYGEARAFVPVEWLREAGRFGGGVRYEAVDETLFNRASVNISQVHYEGAEEKKLGSATAISAIVHPQNPWLPSMHMHISWTEMKDGSGYWRIMADLNPSIEDEASKQRFIERLESVSEAHYREGTEQGDRYFYIPALGRHRGVAHFYLENFNGGDFDADLAYAKRFGEGVIARYIAILQQMQEAHPHYTTREKEIQLAYHTLYLFQVLTLDRGTTSGLLVHDQNDVGILGSLPAFADPELLLSWKGAVPAPQDALIEDIVAALGSRFDLVEITADTKKRLAEAVRAHYRKYPHAIGLQASGNTTPPTVENHR